LARIIGVPVQRIGEILAALALALALALGAQAAAGGADVAASGDFAAPKGASAEA